MANDRDLAVEELKLIQGIIGRQEEVRLRLRSWGITLIAAASVAQLSGELELSASRYLFVSLSVIGLFWFLEAVHRRAEERAILRSAQIESALRGEEQYRGPLIRRSLKQPADWRKRRSEIITQAKHSRVAAIYICLAAIVMVGAALT